MSPAAQTAAQKMEDRRLPDWKLAYRIDEAEAAMGFSKSKLWRLIRAGKIKAKKDDGVTLIERAELQRYLADLPNARE